ncbi:MAG: phosphoenolpyruvate--protein phosphotransferase [Treponema sp.]|jgi:phosphotransferase system enzyme I (PtsI)|nr:phosphoenolpyruvate--protein phosphotransferase [Treponema sp.]
MEQFSGKTVCPGIAFGRICIFEKPDLAIDASPSPDPEGERRAFRDAVRTADGQLAALFEKTKREVGEDEAQIIDIQRMMLEDEDFLGEVETLIREESSRAACAVDRTGKRFYAQFTALEDPYMKARAPDIADISHRLTAILTGADTSFSLRGGSILAAEDLTPSDTLGIDKRMIRAFVTRRGSTNSHTAILARILKIPSIVQADFPLGQDLNGKEAAVDGHRGIIYLEPDGKTENRLREQAERDRDEEKSLDALRGLPTVSRSGQKIELAANIGGVEDLEAVLANDAEGIGLFRSEFLYLGRSDYPGEEEQFAVYRQAAAAMEGKRVVIRTLDIGADKQADYFGIDKEDNPALGYRAVRICIDRPGMFKTQLRALYRAAAFGKVAVMFPMITSLWELKRCKALAAEARQELAGQGVPFGDPELGIMVETPAAALCAGELAGEAAFFSVGTNDLTQYTLAVDRQNAKLEPFLDTRHPAILRLLEMIVESAHRAGIWAGICGELAADPRMTASFLSMGYDELSVSPGCILGLRKRIRTLD